VAIACSETPETNLDTTKRRTTTAVLVELCLNSRGTKMNFIEWTKQQESKSQISVNQKTIKTKQERDRLTRMETMLHELLLLKQIIVKAKTFQAPEKKYATKN
jgi:hypothetical protein